MKLSVILIVMGLTFGLCYLMDKGFTKIFRGKPQHRSGMSVRLNQRYGSMGLAVGAIGVAALLSGVPDSKFLMFGGSLLILLYAGLVTYYMTFGVFYDEDSFLLTTFGKKSRTYPYSQIRAQQLYAVSGGVVIELYLEDGRTVQLQSGMKGVYPFLDTAFVGWLRQTGRRKEDCPFHDPDNSCWFPSLED